MKQKINRIPIIDYIRNKRIPESSKISKKAQPFFESYINMTETLNIYMLTDKFRQNMYKVNDKLLEDKVFLSLQNAEGILIDKDYIICYKIGGLRNTDQHDFILFVFDKDNNLVCGTIQDEKGRMFIDVDRSIFNKFQNITGQDVSKTLYEFTNAWFTNAIVFELFKKYADVEIKTLSAKSKATLFKCKYFNDTDHNIHIMDSTWFTQLVISNAFNVRGHFRLQPCGPELKERKLIWIQDFQKSGYTRKAKVEYSNN